MLKRVGIAFLCLFVLTAQSVTSFVAVYAAEENVSPENTVKDPDGLMYEDGEYHYYENGEMAADIWVNLDGHTYYFDKDGNAVVSKCKVNGKYYVFNNKGQLQQPESKKVIRVKTAEGVKKYLVNPNGTASSGWAENRKFYFNKDMEMAAGIITIKKKFYCFRKDGKYNPGKTAKIRKAAKYEKPFENLKKFIGKPDKSRYYSSCYGNGRDGVLTYACFKVYTFKPAKGKEIFMGVE